jgi:hypothetical protein
LETANINIEDILDIATPLLVVIVGVLYTFSRTGSSRNGHRNSKLGSGS